MSEHETYQRVRRVLLCDGTGCTARIMGPWSEATFQAHRHAVAMAVEAGWTAYAGRTLRHYCAEHAPSRGHQMLHLWGDPR